MQPPSVFCDPLDENCDPLAVECDPQKVKCDPFRRICDPLRISINEVLGTHQKGTKKMYPAESPILSGFFAAQRPFFEVSKS